MLLLHHLSPLNHALLTMVLNILLELREAANGIMIALFLKT
jgi:hypothetical protein